MFHRLCTLDGDCFRRRRQPGSSVHPDRCIHDTWLADDGVVLAAGQCPRHFVRTQRPWSAVTCVGVGDDGANVASIITTNNGGSTWSHGTPPPGVNSLATISCPSATVCYAGGGSGIMKTSDGGTSWSRRIRAFRRCRFLASRLPNAPLLAGLEIVKTTDGSTWNSQVPPSRSEFACIGVRVPERLQHAWPSGWLTRGRQ